VGLPHWPAWRALVPATAVELVRQTGDHLVVPQTVLEERYLSEMAEALRGHGLQLVHVVLDVAPDVLRSRIAGSGESLTWRGEHVAAYVEARAWLTDSADLLVDTTAAPPVEVALTVARCLDLLEPRDPLTQVPGGPV
ncbi:hypothetical protein QUS89_22970, partial [Xanthomonas citri pv. citri]